MQDKDNEWLMDDSTADTPDTGGDNEWDWGSDPEPEPAPAEPTPAADDEDSWDWGEPDPAPEPEPAPWAPPSSPVPEPVEPTTYDEPEGEEDWDDPDVDEEDDDGESGPNPLQRIQDALTGSPKKLIAAGAAGLVLVIALAAILGGLRGGPDEEPIAEPTTTTRTTLPTPKSTSTSASEPATKDIDEVEPFVEKLVAAMNDRDADAYYALLSPTAKETATESVARSAIDGLQKDAKYSYKMKEADAGDDTAVVRFVLTATVGSSSSEQTMEMELSKHDGTWLMELP